MERLPEEADALQKLAPELLAENAVLKAEVAESRIQAHLQAAPCVHVDER